MRRFVRSHRRGHALGEDVPAEVPHVRGDELRRREALRVAEGPEEHLRAGDPWGNLRLKEDAGPLSGYLPIALCENMSIL